jgi:hypothetical protein
MQNTDHTPSGSAQSRQTLESPATNVDKSASPSIGNWTRQITNRGFVGIAIDDKTRNDATIPGGYTAPNCVSLYDQKEGIVVLFPLQKAFEGKSESKLQMEDLSLIGGEDQKEGEEEVYTQLTAGGRSVKLGRIVPTEEFDKANPSEETRVMPNGYMDAKTAGLFDWNEVAVSQFGDNDNPA